MYVYNNTAHKNLKESRRFSGIAHGWLDCSSSPKADLAFRGPLEVVQDGGDEGAPQSCSSTPRRLAQAVDA